jgi:hypothetical protein
MNKIELEGNETIESYFVEEGKANDCLDSKSSFE